MNYTYTITIEYTEGLPFWRLWWEVSDNQSPARVAKGFAMSEKGAERKARKAIKKYEKRKALKAAKRYIHIP